MEKAIIVSAYIVRGADSTVDLGEERYPVADIADVLGKWNSDESRWVPADDVTAVVKFLLGETGQFWAESYSNSEFSPEGWYSYANEDPYTGDRFEYTADLEGFDTSELIEIYERVTRELPGR